MTPHFNFSVETLVMSRPVGWALQWGTLIRKLYPIGRELCNCMFLMSFELDAETLAFDCFVNKRGQVVIQTQNINCHVLWNSFCVGETDLIADWVCIII